MRGGDNHWPGPRGVCNRKPSLRAGLQGVSNGQTEEGPVWPVDLDTPLFSPCMQILIFLQILLVPSIKLFADMDEHICKYGYHMLFTIKDTLVCQYDL